MKMWSRRGGGGSLTAPHAPLPSTGENVWRHVVVLLFGWIFLFFYLKFCVAEKDPPLCSLPPRKGALPQSVPLRRSARQRRVRFRVFRPQGVRWTAGEAAPLHLCAGNPAHRLTCRLTVFVFQVAIKQIPIDRVQQWARLVSSDLTEPRSVRSDGGR